MEQVKSQTLALAAQAFLADPCTVTEDNVLLALNEALVNESYAPLPDGFVEYGCVEDGVVHVCAYEGSTWITIEPNTGEAHTN